MVFLNDQWHPLPSLSIYIYRITLQTILKRYPNVSHNLYEYDIEPHATIMNSTKLKTD